MKFSFRDIAIALAVLFVGAVVGLTMFGKQYLRQMEIGNSTQIYLDLASAEAGNRQWGGAEADYKRAIAVAESGHTDGAALPYALDSYADFLRKRKRLDEAEAIEARARRLIAVSGK